MQITIQLPDELEQHLARCANQLNISLENFILESLEQLTQSSKTKVSEWSDAILSYTGTPDFPAFELYREDLLPPPEMELF
ncbi:hypothetical protein [Limnofasciculus baicalensis]|uniref:Uncharacterized protein n=1 Tax=Limnofasciculus baicalensis BBK-W-15 TaxID=2699891 RepID=A0AAE3GQ24_9CYAN|nr:hypothetical protein [Limnofasciculus baicalensis]MCP2728600.1 hypothetical protein [Limnofasciculus baicalensis BBK-W-15]